MIVFRASSGSKQNFDPLDARPSIARDGWRFNDKNSAVLYAAETQALALLEVVVRPGWDTVDTVTVAMIEVPDGTILELEALGILLPTNWNARPVARDSQAVGAQFLTAAARSGDPPICGVRVPSVISSTDFNVLLDPRERDRYSAIGWTLIPFQTLKGTET